MIDIEVKHPTIQFTKEEVQKMLAQYNRTLDNVQVDVDCIKTWVNTQPHLTHMPEDRLILNLLILNKFVFEKTKSKLDYYYSVKGLLPEVFVYYFPSNKEIIKIRQIIRCCVLPNLINLDRVVIYVLDNMQQKFDGYASLAKTVMDIDALLCQDISSSFSLIADCSGSTFAFWSTFTPIMAKICVNFSERVLSNRLRTLRFIGLPAVAQSMISYALSLLPPKIRDRVFFHRECREMTKIYPIELLPAEFGGTGPSYRKMSADFNNMVDQCEEYFNQFRGFKVDEKMRPTPLDNDEILGFHGNFRKLEVD